MLLSLLSLLVVVVAQATAVCPPSRSEMRYGNHGIPLTVFYTGKYDSHLEKLTLDGGKWPANVTFAYFDNDALERSVKELSRMLEEEGVLGLAEAFEAIQPWAYKADLWRYAQLWACGGIYLDAKLALAQDLVKFLNLAGFHHAALRETKVPLLLTCHDERASESIREPTLRRIKCVYQAFMVAEPRHPALLKTIRHVVANVRDRWYPPASLSKYGNLFITGPCAMGLATQIDDPRWEDSIKLTTRLGYNQLGRRPWQAIRYIVGNWIPRGRDADDEMSLAAFVANERVHSTERTNYYVGMFARHEVYVDDHQKKTDASSIRLSYKSPSPE